MISRCPCRKCLIEPVCKDPCDDFSKFAAPLNKLLGFFENFFGAIDDIIGEFSKLSSLYDWFGEHFILPISFYLFIKLFAIKTDMKGVTLFDERLSIWEERLEK